MLAGGPPRTAAVKAVTSYWWRAGAASVAGGPIDASVSYVPGIMARPPTRHRLLASIVAKHQQLNTIGS